MKNKNLYNKYNNRNNIYARNKSIRNVINKFIDVHILSEYGETIDHLLLLENNQTIVATKYQLYLPSEKQLLDELRKVNELNEGVILSVKNYNFKL